MKRFRNYVSGIFMLIMVAVLSVGCASTEEVTNTQETLTIVDPAGNEVIVPSEIKSIISLAPSITEVLVELGYGDKIILTDSDSKKIEGLPEEIEAIDILTPDVEQMISLKPDIVLASEMTATQGSDPSEQLNKVGIPVAYIPTSNSIEGIYSDIMFIGKALEEEEKAQELVDHTKEKIDEIAKIGETIEDKKTVYFEISAAPYLYSFGEGVFLNEMIEIIGAQNVLSEEKEWISVSEELVIASDPEVILTNVNYIENPIEEIKSRAGWSNMKAIKNNDVYYIDNFSSSLPNHNIVKALEEMAKAVYPEKFTK